MEALLEILRWSMLIVYVICCVGLIVIVLLQKGKGTSFAGAFGVGPGSDAVFGPRARKSLPVRLTYIMAGLFLVLALSLSVVEGKVFEGAAPEEATVEDVEGEVSQLPEQAEDDAGALLPAEAEVPAEAGAAVTPEAAPEAEAPADVAASDAEAAPAEPAAPTEAAPTESAGSAEPAAPETGAAQ